MKKLILVPSYHPSPSEGYNFTKLSGVTIVVCIVLGNSIQLNASTKKPFLNINTFVIVAN